MNMYQAMADGEIHGSVEIWSSNVSDDYAKKAAEGGITEIGDLGLEAKEGLAYPVHVEALCPGLPAWGPNPDATNDCGFAGTRVFKATWSGFQEKWPAAAEILANFQMDVADQQPLMGEIDVDGKSVEEAVAAWMDANEGKWKPIVDAALN